MARTALICFTAGAIFLSIGIILGQSPELPAFLRSDALRGLEPAAFVSHLIALAFVACGFIFRNR